MSASVIKRFPTLQYPAGLRTGSSLHQFPTLNKTQALVAALRAFNPVLLLLADAGTLQGNGTPAVSGDPLTAAVATWQDQSGNGNNAAQATVMARPMLTAAAVNGRGALTFDSLDDSLAGTALPDGTQLLVIVYAVVGSGDQAVITTAANDTRWRYSGDGNGYWGILRIGRTAGYPVALPISGAHIASIASTPETYEAFIDGVSQGASAGSYSAGNILQIGADTTHGNVRIALIFAGSTPSNRAVIETALAAYYGL